MTKLLKSILAASLIAIPALSMAAADSLILNGRNSTDDGNQAWVMGPPSQDSIVYYNATAKAPQFATVGSGLQLSGGVISSTVSSGPLIQRTSVTTDSSGVITWTYPTSFGATPVISAVVNGANTSVWNAQITSKSSTSVTIQVKRNTPTFLSLLGVDILSVNSSPQATVDIVAIAP